MVPIKLACHADPEKWFPVGKSGPALQARAEAMTECDACPVLAACLSKAIALRATDGIWGGMDFAAERAHLPGSGHVLRRELEKDVEADIEPEDALQNA